MKTKYGPDYSSKITKLVTGTGLMQNANYNNGKPWFVSFRPLLSDVDVELNLATDKLKQGLFTMAESYIESVKNRVKTM